MKLGTDFDFSPRFESPSKKMALVMLCRFSGSESSTSSQQTSTNQQTVAGNVGAGGFSSVTGAGGSSQTEINVTSADPHVFDTAASAITSVAASAIANNTTTASNAIQSNYGTTIAALGFGAETTKDTLAFANNAVNAVAFVANAGQSEASQVNAASQETIRTISTDLATLTANATPQTTAAANELINGTSPLAGATPQKQIDWTTIALVGGTLIALLSYLKQK